MIPLNAVLFGLATVLVTIIGGNIAMRLKRFINPLIAFCGGTLVALALLDLVPEALELLEGTEPHSILLLVLGAFLVTHFLDKLLLFHSHSHSEDCSEHSNEPKGIASMSGLGLHSFLDGVIIGTGFLVDNSTGVLIGTVILLHRLSDGLNSITLSIRNKSKDSTARRFLFVNSITPLLGILLSGFMDLSESTLAYILCIFAGFFLYIGATDLLPEAHKERSSVKLVLFTLLGAFIVGLVSFFSH